MHTIDMIPQIGFALELGVTSVAFILKPKMFSLHLQIELLNNIKSKSRESLRISQNLISDECLL